nr:MAG TPA: hypothetical protein [Caudoviricetes sp.]
MTFLLYRVAMHQKLHTGVIITGIILILQNTVC